MATTASSGGGDAFQVKSTASGSHLLQIDGYSVTKHVPVGTNFKSCPFTVGGYRWILYLFPNGDRTDSVGFISVFLGLGDRIPRFVRLQLELSFVDETDKQDPAHVRTRQVVDLLSRCGVGYTRFIAREALEKSKHLKDDHFTVRCDFIVSEYTLVRENLHAGTDRKCVGCNLRLATVPWLPLIHACFCAVCTDASHNDPAAKQCAGCHGPLQGIFLPQCYY
ncbi:hypothetical protein ACQ4PT_042998 [Festuca glaucescens]